MFWKRKAKTATTQVVKTPHFASMLPTDDAGAIFAALAQRRFRQRRDQINWWFDQMATKHGAAARQIDAAKAFGLTQGRISQLMH